MYDPICYFQDKDGTYKWLDGWPVFFTKWGRNEPSMGEGEGCVRVNSDVNWQDHGCDNQYPYICKISFGKSNNISNLWL